MLMQDVRLGAHNAVHELCSLTQTAKMDRTYKSVIAYRLTDDPREDSVPGGTAAIITRPWADRTFSLERDLKRWGRYTKIRIVGRRNSAPRASFQKHMIVYNVYMPIENPSKGSCWSRQREASNNPQFDPFRGLLAELTKDMSGHMRKGASILVTGDFNSLYRDGQKG